MPIIASRSGEIRQLLSALSDPKRRAGAAIRLEAIGSRVVPYVAEELGRLTLSARRVLLEALRDVHTAEAETLRKRLIRSQAEPAADPKAAVGRRSPRGRLFVDGTDDPETKALADLRALPPPRRDERAAVSRARGEAHLALARTGSRLARRDLLTSFKTLSPGRTPIYCEAAGLIGDEAFLAPLARIALIRPEAGKALESIAKREKISKRSNAFRNLEKPLRLIVAKSIDGAADS